MKITKELREWLVKNCDVKEDATDDECRTAAGNVMASGKLTADMFMKLTKDDQEDELDGFSKKLNAIADGIGKLTDVLTKQAEVKPEVEAGTIPEVKPEVKEVVVPEKKAVPPSRLAKMIAQIGGTAVEVDGKDIDVRVKEAAEMYRTDKSVQKYPEQTKSGKPHPFSGQPVSRFGKALYTSSDQDKAVAGAWAKFQIAHAMRGVTATAWASMPDHDKELICWATENAEWDNSKDGKASSTKGYPGGIKTLIDDATSGGLEAAPIVFDDQVIETPLLWGELFPLVNIVPLDRGRRVEGVSTGTVTGSWGGVDDTSIPLFATAAYVAAFDTTVYRWEGAFKIGMDFMSDTPIDFGAHVTRQYGERLLEDLDDVVATGNGTTQPQGVMNASGATSVAFGGTTTLGNYESLRFGVGKNEHRPNVVASAVFCGTETSYQRARAIPVGASDARRLSGMDYDSYQYMERPYKINESLANTQIFYAILARYRMYQRRGLVIRTASEGQTLVRENNIMIVAMARYGGQMERGGAVALTTTAPA